MSTLAKTSPDLTAQWHPDKNGDLDPNKVRVNSHKKVWWQCEQGHEWETTVAHRTRGQGCPYCSGRRVIPGETDFATLYPDIVTQWHREKNSDTNPQELKPYSHQKFWWQCKYGHEWKVSVSHRTRGRGCPYCAGQKVLSGENDLETLHPEVAKQWHPDKNGDLTPNQVFPRSDRKVWWQGTCGHEWKTTIGHRVNGTGCPYCSGHKVLYQWNDLATLRPELAAQWHPDKNDALLPEHVSLGSEVRAWWLCEKGHEWRATIDGRVRRNNGCPYCWGRVAFPGETDLATLRPELAAQWHPTKNETLTPDQVRPGSDRQVWWKCDTGHEWSAGIYSRAAGNGCPRCSMNSTSEQEVILGEWLEKLGVQVTSNIRRVIPPFEVDIYLPDHRLAIEYNGLYWHSEATGKNKDYHLKKTLAAKEKGIALIHVWEDDWRDRKEIVLRGLAHRLGVTHKLREVLPDLPEYYTQTIGARQTTITTLTYTQASEFLDQNHIQGGSTGTHYLGLLDKEQRLRAVLVIKKTVNLGEYTIERYATAGVVQGGFSKLLKRAEKTYQPKRWVTFTDLSLSNSELYEKTGFTAEKTLKPDYSYLVGDKRVHKFNYRLKRFRTDPNLQYEDGLTERELALLNRLARIWDCGKVRYIKDIVGI